MAARPRRKRDPLAPAGLGITFRSPPTDETVKPPRKGTSYTGPISDAASVAADPKAKTWQKTEAGQPAAAAQRRTWEKSPEGKARTSDAKTLMTERGKAEVQRLNDKHFTPEEQARGLGFKQGSSGGYDKMGVGAIYEHHGWGTPVTPGHETAQAPLPGMGRDDAAPESTRFEDKSVHEWRRTQRALAAHGSSLEQMEKDYGAQLDQANVRSSKYGTHPFSQHFYGDTSAPSVEGDPLKPAAVLHQGAASLKIPLGVHVAMNAFTSPNTKFTAGKGQNMYYPNDETARSVVKQVQAGVSAKEVIPGTREADPTKKNQGYRTNTRKAADALEQHYEGKRVADWKGRISTVLKDNPSKGLTAGQVVDVPENKQVSPFGAKTAPYHNAWLPGAQDYFVSDVHSGGGGMLPHLSSEKPVMYHPDGSPQLDKDGKPKRDKSEREKAIEAIPNFHEAADYAARRAHTARGITSTKQGQAGQWGEEQIQRGIETEQHRYGDHQARRSAVVQSGGVFNDRRDPTLF